MHTFPGGRKGAETCSAFSRRCRGVRMQQVTQDGLPVAPLDARSFPHDIARALLGKAVALLHVGALLRLEAKLAGPLRQNRRRCWIATPRTRALIREPARSAARATASRPSCAVCAHCRPISWSTNCRCFAAALCLSCNCVSTLAHAIRKAVFWGELHVFYEAGVSVLPGSRDADTAMCEHQCGEPAMAALLCAQGS